MTSSLTRLKWNGQDLDPLPYESSVSYVWRFQWRNHLPNQNMLELFLDDYPGIVAFNPEKFLELTEWIDKSKNFNHGRWDRGGRNLFRTRSNFTFCPICLVDGYHSIWHQWQMLDRCPIHLIKLVDSCYTCRKSFRTDGLSIKISKTKSKSILCRPYSCPNCQSSFAGMMPELSAHLEFRDHFNEFKSHLDPIMTFFLANETELENSERMHSNSDEYIPTLKDLTLRVVFLGQPIPGILEQCLYSTFTSIVDCIDLDADKIDRKYRAHVRGGNIRIDRIIEKLYQRFLLRIENWLTRCHGLTPEKYKNYLSFDWTQHKWQSSECFAKLNLYILALTLMRRELEKSNFDTSSRYDFEQRKPKSIGRFNEFAYLPSYLVISRKKVEGFFYSLFASWYQRCLVADYIGIRPQHRRSKAQSRWAFSNSRPIVIEGNNNTSRYMLWYVFPSIEGMPIPEWLVSKKIIPSESSR